MHKDFIQEYKLDLFYGIAMMLFSCVFIYFASQFAPITIPALHLIFVIIISLSLIIHLWKTQVKKLLTRLCISLLPMAIPFTLISLWDDITLPTISLIVGLSGITLSLVWGATYLLLSFKAKRTKPHTRPTLRILFGSLPAFLSVIVLSLIFLSICLTGISKQTLVDEPLWMFDRVESYTANTLSGDLYHSRPSDKPGVTVAALSSLALPFFDDTRTLKETITPQTYKQLAGAMRIPLVVFVTMLLPVLFVLLRHIFSTAISLLTLLGITFSPILIGMTRTLNPDALLWILLPLGFFSFYLALRIPRRRTVLVAGVILGLGLLTKYVTNILVVFFPLMIFVQTLFDAHDLPAVHESLKKRFKIYACVTLISIAIFAVFLPSTWVYPFHILKGTLLSQAFGPLWFPFVVVLAFISWDLFLRPRSKSFFSRSLLACKKIQHAIAPTIIGVTITIIVFVLFSSHFTSWINYQEILTSPKSAYRDHGTFGLLFSGYYGLIYGVHPLVLLAGLGGLLHVAVRKSHRQLIPVTLMTLFIALYYAGAIAGSVAATIRYQIVLYPFFMVFAAIGLYAIFKRISLTPRLIIYTLFSCALAGSLWMSSPFYFSYANSLLPNDHILSIKDMGDGSYQAAAYLNALPGASSLTIWADKAGVCASFVGECTTTVHQRRIAQRGYDFDYYVISRTREHLTTRSARSGASIQTTAATFYNFSLLYETSNSPRHKIPLDSREYNAVSVFDANTFNIVEQTTPSQRAL